MIILFFCHLVCYIISIILRIIIYKYIKKKPPGQQSVLDLLILDIISLQAFYSTSFLVVMLVGLLHGQVPFILSQVLILVLTLIPITMSTCLCQCFLIVKAILIFKGHWIADLSDTLVIGTTRLAALIYTTLILLGNYWLQGAKPAAVTVFLTGKLENSYAKIGPFHAILCLG